MEGPNALLRPPVGKVVREPERRRLLRSETAEAEAIEAECRRLGRDEVGLVATGEDVCEKESVSYPGESGVLSRVEAKCWAARETLEGKVPALARLKFWGKLVGGRGRAWSPPPPPSL